MSKLKLIIASMLVALGAASPAGADAVYHSAHMELSPLGGEPLRSGFVENIHANGPQVYAHEVYVLNGARADMAYEVRLLVFTSPTCSGPAAPIAATPLMTNAAGNGRAELVIAPSPTIPAGITVGVHWEVALGGVPVYTTGCSSVTLD